MLLATTQVEDFDRFLEVFSTAGAEKRREHGSKGALVFRDPPRTTASGSIFDWDERGLAELRLRPRGAADHEGGRAQGEAAGRAVRRPLRRVGLRLDRGPSRSHGAGPVTSAGDVR